MTRSANASPNTSGFADHREVAFVAGPVATRVLWLMLVARLVAKAVLELFPQTLPELFPRSLPELKRS